MVKEVEMERGMLRLTSTSHDDGVPLLICKGDESAATLLQTAVLACSSGALASVGTDAISPSDDRFRSAVAILT
jgi:hypothetical protein